MDFTNHFGKAGVACVKQQPAWGHSGLRETLKSYAEACLPVLRPGQLPKLRHLSYLKHKIRQKETFIMSVSVLGALSY